MGAMDHTILRNGNSVHRANLEWNRNGTAAQGENQVLTLEEYLSYDEIMLSSLIGVSGESFFVNDGGRYNCGKKGQPGTFEERGVIIGLVGARFERLDRMDSLFVLKSEGKSSMDPMLMRIFEDFFGTVSKATSGFDVQMYKARMRITVDILLLEANARATEAGKKAHVYIVGLGLGVWQKNREQARWYVETFTSALGELGLENVKILEFAYIGGVPGATVEEVTTAGTKAGIKVVFSERNPAAKLPSDELLVLSYAWDGNAFPGNE